MSLPQGDAIPSAILAPHVALPLALPTVMSIIMDKKHNMLYFTNILTARDIRGSAILRADNG